jgi:ABC-type nitrate/sulfonate/bicarbonate transport system substrate-binding protein
VEFGSIRADPVTITESVFVVPALSAIARQRGFFDMNGVDVATVHTPSSASQRADLDSGAVDVAVTATDNILAWNASGSDVVLVAQIETTTDLALVCRTGLGPLGVAGRFRLAVDAPTNGFAIVAYAMLADQGLARSYAVVEVGGVRERLAALDSSTADVTLLAPPLLDHAIEEGMTVETRVSEWLPSYPGLGVVTARQSPPAVRAQVHAYVRALAQANDWMRDAPEFELRAALDECDIRGAAATSVKARIPSTLAPTVEALRVLGRLRRDTGTTIDGLPDVGTMVNTDAVSSPGLQD